ncbi:ArsB/NhaD family transporter [Sporichthya sp.]|uniref:SLC13 family permease n=1 Tax=Sporichthya sp. TaxID=65475 RepID=UPI00183042DA|nr:ArsB/NhaD family transporter [Sporichthya sp.]MBA3744029.1 ArsB/NhaD family transporter [Sporichthya sp.]
MTETLTVAIFVIAYILIATEKIHRVTAALGGAAAMVLIGVADTHTAFFSEETGVDWNVIFLLLGMMIIVGVVKQTGVFEYLAIWAAKRAGGQPFRVMVLLVVITAVASALLDNVTTVLLVAPVTLLVCDRIGNSAVPFLIAEAMASNIGGAATLIGDPPNIIIASRSGLSFNDFVLNLAPIIVVLMVVFIGMCKLMFGRQLEYHPERVAEVMSLDERQAIRDPAMLVRCLVILGGVTIAFALHSALHVEPAIVALLGAGAIIAVTQSPPEQFLEEVEWPTLVFFMGLFIMVGGLVEVGVIGDLGEKATEAAQGHYLAASTGLLFGSAVLSGLVDNIPYVATMAPLTLDLVNAAPTPVEGNALWWSLALGADLGGNATAVGASANVVVLGIAARNGVPISFWTFTKYGLIVASVTVALSWPYVYLRYFVLG